VKTRHVVAREALIWLATVAGWAVTVTYLPLPFGRRGPDPSLVNSLIWGVVFATLLLVRRLTAGRDRSGGEGVDLAEEREQQVEHRGRLVDLGEGAGAVDEV
jgi:hypothetical protein